MELHLEFLRPLWFLAILPVVWLLWRAWRLSDPKGQWQRVIAPPFQRLLLGDDSHAQGLSGRRLAVIGLAALWIMAIVALAGPSLKSVKLPAQKSQQGTVIVLDLSLSMLADDLKPNRLSRVRFKLLDLLKAHPEQAFGMVAYSGTAHTIAPISEDNQTLLALVPTLTPLMMPSYGSDPLAAFEQAGRLLQGAHITQGHLIWVTDDLEAVQSDELANWLKQSGYTLSILAVGTPQGGAVNLPNYGLLKNDQGAIVLPALPYETLRQFSLHSGAALTPLTVDDSDLQSLLPGLLGSALAESETNKPQEKAVLHPLDDGSAILLALLLPFALAFRRGWLLTITLLLTLPLGAFYSPPSFADYKLSDLADVFQTPDQQGYKAWQKKDYAAAEALFENSQWKGSALYENGKYKEAAEQFKKDPSASGLYNLGNALAQQGKLMEAKQAYEKALQRQPEMADAKANLDLINRLLEQQQSSSENNANPSAEKQPNAMQDAMQNATPKPENAAQNSPKNGETAPSTESEKQQNAGSELQNKTQQAGSDKDDNPQTADKNQPSPSADQDKDKGKDTNSAQATATNQKSDDKPVGDQANSEVMPSAPTQQGKALAEQKQATQNWLQQIPDEPGLFLKRKFQYQFDNAARTPSQAQNSANSRETKNSANSRETNPTQAGKKIW
ncbi:VWA domain-containing protein [Thiomicrorhabdus cannonii]|uniref:VWA domain-containing protein n=1 Tax=Thiomicrorhabdus cannonii TaxID=2748011 RepID=UPI0015BE2A43|nr:VWA domain-containing protein [Thiomicrorhabdus cannonii]